MTDRYERIRTALAKGAYLTAVCDRDMIRELLAERDELLEALQLLFNAAYFGVATSVEFGRAEAAIEKATVLYTED